MAISNPPSILIPLDITAAMMTSSSIAEPDTGETAWVSAGSYAAGGIRISTTTHRKYLALQTHSGRTALPESDPAYWKDVGATNKYAMFDARRTTQSTATTSLTFNLKPGFFNAIAFYDLSGATLSVVVKDSPTGAVIFSETRSLVGPFFDEYDYCYGAYRELTSHYFTDITPYPDAEITVTVTAGTGNKVGIGKMVVGDLRPLILGDFGGATYGASATPVTSSYIDVDEFGDLSITKRASGTDQRINIVLPSGDADYALACIREVLDVPVAFLAGKNGRFSGLNGYGLISGPVSYAGGTYSTIDLYLKGLY